MDDFKTIYRILKALDAGMDCDAPIPRRTPPRLSESQRTAGDNLVAMMQQELNAGPVYDRRSTI